MTKTALLGYPRIGLKRELKFAEEKFFRNEISADDLLKTASNIRSSNWKYLKDSGIDIIPALDFSLYDNVLDLAYALNIIPKRFRNIELSDLELYFALARGIQNEKIDAEALAMKKWFNTNYHYLVPEFDAGTKLNVNAEFLKKQLIQAKEENVNVRATIVGPYTFIKLVKFEENLDYKKAEQEILQAYISLIAELKGTGIAEITVQEPWLVKDLSEADVNEFLGIHKTLQEQSGIDFYLSTYFGDIRDVIKKLPELNFKGLSLDLVEGPNNVNLIKNVNFDKDFEVSLGIVSGINIWKNSYEKSLNKIKALTEKFDNVVISSSSSLLHVPLSLSTEKVLPETQKVWLAFAEEKVKEIVDLRNILDNKDAQGAFENNKKLFQNSRIEEDKEIVDKVVNLSEDNFKRTPNREARAEIQRQKLGLPLLPTTTIGSFPQTTEIRELRKKLRNNEISNEEYESSIKTHIKECIEHQEQIGLDVLVHGEFERNDMVEYFGRKLSGYLFTENGWVQSYGTRCVKPPVIWGTVKRNAPMTVEVSSYAQSLSKRPVKGMLTGPVTIFNWSFPREDVSKKESILELALAIKDEVDDLEKAGIKIIQIDEAALREKLPLRKNEWHPEYLDIAIPAFRLVTSEVAPETQIHTHMCYSEFGDIIHDIDDMDADVISFEASRSNLELLGYLKDCGFETAVGPGVYDIHSPRIPSEEEITLKLRKMLSVISSSKLWVNPDCGLKTRGNKETWPSLTNLVNAAKEVRKELKS